LVAGILLIILYRHINFFDQVAGTKFHAGMLEIRFRAGTKTLWVPVYYFSYCTGKHCFWNILPVQNVLPV
jgi:hypothetical protein